MDENDQNMNSESQGSSKKPIDKTLVLFLCSIALCIAGIIAFFVVANSSFGAVNAAKKFYYSIITNNPDDAFDMMDVKKSDFVNKKTFAKTIGLTKDQISSYDAENLKDLDFSKSGGSMDSTNTVYVTGNEAFDTYGNLSINLNRDGKAFGIFPNWKVEASGLIVHDITFEVPKGAALTIDDKTVDTKYIDDSLSEDGYDGYVIPEMLIGEYEASVSVEGLDAKPSYQYVTGDEDKFYLEYGEPDESVMKDVSQKNYDAFTTVLTAAKDGSDFSTVEAAIDSYGNAADLKDDYQSLADEFAPDAYGTGVTSIEFTNIKTKADFSKYEVLPAIVVTLTADIKIHYNTESLDSGVLNDTVDTDSIIIYGNYVLKDGEWVLDVENSHLVPYF